MLEITTRRTALLLLDFENYSVHPDGYSPNRTRPLRYGEGGRWQTRDGRSRRHARPA
jgi:hypothetical protein